MQDSRYRGRFAPSPTGLLHFGSLVTAVASHVDARQQGGAWLLRIDDLDQTRCVAGMDRRILRSLEAFGMGWDEQPTCQSACTNHYRQALDQLLRQQLAYVCTCSRKQVAEQSRGAGLEGPLYADTCRQAGHNDAPDRAIRLRTDDQPITFLDRVQGHQRQYLHRQIGDFVIRRADGYFAYQLAVVIDDHLAGINQVVRGADLLHSTPRQLYLQRLLGLARPAYLHLPLAIDRDGRKLSKRGQAHPIDEQNPLPALLAAWRFLGQKMPQGSEQPANVDSFWQWAIAHWQVGCVPARLAITDTTRSAAASSLTTGVID